MKKFRLITFIMLFIFPTIVFAQEVDNVKYDITNVYSSVEMDIIGSLHVKEAIVVKGSLNGFRRELLYKNSNLKDWEEGNIDFDNSSIYNARGVSLKKVSSKKISKDDISWDLLNALFTEFKENKEASVGDTEVYTEKRLENGTEIKIFNPNDSGYVVYYFDYFIDQAVVMHNDIAELYYTVFRLNEDVDNIKIQVTTPGASTNKTFRAWAHGSITGKLSLISEHKDADGNELYKGALIEVEDYKKEELIEIRMTFDKRLVSALDSVLNDSGMDALEKIEEIEQVKYEKADKEKRYYKIVFYSAISTTGLYIVGLIILWIIMYKKYDKEYRVNFDAKYFREFTGSYEVEVIDYLMKKDVTQDAMNASIMNLIFKKNIIVEEIPNEKKNMLLTLKTKDGVTESEKILLELLFETIGKDNKVTLKEIEKFSKKYETANEFMTMYDRWKLSVTRDGQKEEFFESHTTPKVCGGIYFALGIILMIILLCLNVQVIPLYIILFIGSLMFFIYTLSFKKWTKKGREHYLKWNAFKQFLLDFGSFKDKEIPEIALWDKYLVYATVFGIAKEVERSMKVQLTNLGMDDTTYIPSIFYYRDFYLVNSINSSISKAHTNSISTVTSHNAGGTIGGGSGFGGGFGGGGGFAGGGGGGGGF